MTTVRASGLPPSIVVSQHDMDRLDAMLESPQWRRHAAADALLAELARAEVRDAADMPAGVVGMHSRVECVDERSGDRHELTLVFPQEADVDAGKVSILAPVGSALLGLSVGQSIDWTTPDGRPLRLRVTAIRYQPESSGDFNR